MGIGIVKEILTKNYKIVAYIPKFCFQFVTIPFLD